MKSNKETSFLHHIFHLGAGSFLYLLIGAIGTPILTRLVSPDTYGSVSMLNVYGQIGMMLCGIGLDQTLVHHYYDEPSPEKQRNLLFRCSGTALGMSVIVANLLCMLFRSAKEIYLLALYIPTLLLYRFSMVTLRLSYQTRAYSAIQILQKAAYLLIGISAVLLSTVQHEVSLAVATVLSTLIASLIAFGCGRERWLPLHLTETCSVKHSALIAYGLPIMLSSGIHMLFQAMDRLFLNYFCELSVVGIYTSALNLIAVFSVVRTAFTAIWLTTALDHHADNPKDHTFFVRGNSCISVVMICFAAGVVLCKDLFALLLGPQYQAAAFLLPWLIFEPVLYTISETTAVSIATQKKPVYQLLVAIGSCTANFLGNLWLTPIMGANGAAISTAVSYLLFYLLRTIFAHKIDPIPYSHRSFAISIFALLVFSCYSSRHAFTPVQIPMCLAVLAVTFACYKDTVRFMLDYLLDMLRKRKRH